jgi:hypothetical protein
MDDIDEGPCFSEVKQSYICKCHVCESRFKGSQIINLIGSSNPIQREFKSYIEVTPEKIKQNPNLLSPMDFSRFVRTGEL